MQPRGEHHRGRCLCRCSTAAKAKSFILLTLVLTEEMAQMPDDYVHETQRLKGRAGGPPHAGQTSPRAQAEALCFNPWCGARGLPGARGRSRGPGADTIASRSSRPSAWRPGGGGDWGSISRSTTTTSAPNRSWSFCAECAAISGATSCRCWTAGACTGRQFAILLKMAPGGLISNGSLGPRTQPMRRALEPHQVQQAGQLHPARAGRPAG